MSRSFKVEVIADDSGHWAGNALRFESEGGAEMYARGLMLRWSAVRDWRVVPSDDPPDPYVRPTIERLQ
jgi:hypothetical protein